MKPVLIALLLCLPVAAHGQTVLPAFHDVSGVAANDVLNVRAEPDAQSPIVGSLAPGLVGVEIVRTSEDGKWGLVNLGEVSGWASLSFLKPQARPAWHSLQGGLQCAGTEPFWSLSLDPAAQKATISSPDAGPVSLDIQASWPGEDWRPVAAVDLGGANGAGLATFRAEACSDGMSDMAFGLKADIFLQAAGQFPATAWQGCCTLIP